MATMTINVPDDDVPRINAAFKAMNTTPHAATIALLKDTTHGYEHQQHQQGSHEDFESGYDPVNPT